MLEAASHRRAWLIVEMVEDLPTGQSAGVKHCLSTSIGALQSIAAEAAVLQIEPPLYFGSMLT